MQQVHSDEIRSLVVETLGGGNAIEQLTMESPLYGVVPELDSIAVVNLLLAIEEQYQIRIHDDEVEESMFATMGTLQRFVQAKVKGRAHVAQPPG